MPESAKDSMLPDGTPAKILTQAQVDVLIEIIEERLWQRGLIRRVSAISRYATVGATILVGISLWWPWINRIMTGLFTGIPS